MKINPEIFRLYDIRGIYPQDINEEMAYQVGRYFIHFLRKKSKKKTLTVGIAKDIRYSSPELFRGLSKGIIHEGCNIIDLGLIITPALYFAVSHLRLDGGIIITASHNPNPFNGFKLTREKTIPLSGETGIFWIRDQLAKKAFQKEKLPLFKGKITKKNIEKDYINSVFKLNKINKKIFKKLSVAIDAGNGMGGPIFLKVLKKIGIKVYPIYCKPDGDFPNHVPDPSFRNNLKDIVSLVRKKRPNFGIILDGDADRIIFIDEKGNPIRGDLITALMAKIILKEWKGKNKPKILYDIRSSNVLKEVIKEEGGVPIHFKIGHALIKEKMRKDNIFFGGELTGHYYLGQNLFYEVPFFVFLKIVNEMKKTKKTLSELIKPLQKYFHSGEIYFETKAKEGKIKELKKKYKTGKISEQDGLRVDFNDWWFLVRPSNTEPVIKLVVEAKTRNLMEKKRKELIKNIGAPMFSRPLSYRTADLHKKKKTY
ncbi:MAG: phosphomannomutase/phosphoglucomutase [Candidatus Pacebacteria bacterium]|nr:phosphomannomutase/phosphoglucomutase [Candidatus Paceibacterota bacterium]